GRPQLEVRRTGPAQRTAAEQRSAKVRPAAAGAADDPARRALERRVARVEHAGLVEHAKGGLPTLDDDLVASRTGDGTLRVRPEVRLDAEVGEQPERAPRDDRLGDVEVEKELSPPAKVQAPGRVEEP